MCVCVWGGGGGGCIEKKGINLREIFVPIVLLLLLICLRSYPSIQIHSFDINYSW